MTDYEGRLITTSHSAPRLVTTPTDFQTTESYYAAMLRVQDALMVDSHKQYTDGYSDGYDDALRDMGDGVAWYVMAGAWVWGALIGFAAAWAWL